MVVPGFCELVSVVVVGTPSLDPLLSHLISSEVGGLHGLHDHVDHVKGRLPGLGKPASPLFRVVVGRSFVFVCVELVKGVAHVVDCNIGR